MAISCVISQHRFDFKGWPGITVFFLDEEPFLLLQPCQYEGALKYLAFEEEFQAAFRKIDVYRLIGTGIPYDDRTCAVLPVRYDALKGAVIEWVVIYHYGKSFVLRRQGRTFGDSPGLERSVHLKPEIIVEMTGMVFMDNEVRHDGPLRMAFLARSKIVFMVAGGIAPVDTRLGKGGEIGLCGRHPMRLVTITALWDSLGIVCGMRHVPVRGDPFPARGLVIDVPREFIERPMAMDAAIH